MSPFRSEAQRRYMHEHMPETAAQWERETPPGSLPEKVERPPKGAVVPVKRPKVRKVKPA